MKKLICDMDLAREHELFGTDILVFSALCYLCYRGDWELNYTKLAEEARCGSYMTAKRACDTLLQKHLIAVTGKMVHIITTQNEQPTTQIVQSTTQNVYPTTQNVYPTTQNEHPITQNVYPITQNVYFSEKESTKEKEIKKIS